MSDMGSDIVSGRAAATARAHALLMDFATHSPWARRRQEPGISDFTFGNPHEMPLPGLVDALRRWTEPRRTDWFAYTMSEPRAQEVVAAALRRELDLQFELSDIAMTNGAFAAIQVALQLVADVGDEALFAVPSWFNYEPMLINAGLGPIKVRLRHPDFDLDLEAIERAITPRTRVVIVNSPHNPTGRIYPPKTLRALAELLERASVRHGRRIFLLSDEPYRRIVFASHRFHSPAEFYQWTLISYSYGKVLLSPGERIGYLAVSPLMPERAALQARLPLVQIACGWAFPNATLQYAIEELEALSIDLGQLQAKRDRLVAALRRIGYEVKAPDGTFYLLPKSPVPDEEAFVACLAERDVFVIPGRLQDIPGYFRISLTATDEMIERSVPAFAAAFEQTRAQCVARSPQSCLRRASRPQFQR